MTANDLLDHIFRDADHSLAAPFATWLEQLPRFQTFVTTYRDKIRKKLRVTQDPEGLRDLQAEFEIAYWLLQERRFAVEYEKFGVGKTRGPDLTVTFGSVLFNVEVTRMRAGAREQRLLLDIPAAEQPIESLPSAAVYTDARLSDIVSNKLGQMVPNMINMLCIVADAGVIDEIDLPETMARLKRRAEQRDHTMLARHGFATTADFFRQYQWLSGILLRTNHAQNGHRALWINRETRQPLPGKLRTILESL